MSLTINGSGGGTPVGTPQIETGSYTGLSTHANSITFNGVPKYVRIRGALGNGDFFPDYEKAYTNYYFSNKTEGYTLTVTVSGTTMTWSSSYTGTTKTYAELNVSNATYYYMALTV